MWQLFGDEESNVLAVSSVPWGALRDTAHLWSWSHFTSEFLFDPKRLFNEDIWFLFYFWSLSFLSMCEVSAWFTQADIHLAHCSKWQIFLFCISLSLSLFPLPLVFFFLTSNTPFPFHSHSHHLPLGNGSWDGRRDGWCCFELWHVSMQVTPLLFINNWPGPSVGAIYRADYRFAKEHKLLQLYFFLFLVYPNENLKQKV